MLFHAHDSCSTFSRTRYILTLCPKTSTSSLDASALSIYTAVPTATLSGWFISFINFGYSVSKSAHSKAELKSRLRNTYRLIAGFLVISIMSQSHTFFSRLKKGHTVKYAHRPYVKYTSKYNSVRALLVGELTCGVP
ncbi:hypothetical protein B0H63DRAFT_183812 [Podospora didyma]|uniref:Uncharacterized protein n=1 Tax=Podospora didyma TaxID=330526 RepID=A0AAE0TZM4_9PEZI|nr:hypothetical protein B0H63DRAFT_183812 [Podospora didyma]